MAGLVAKSREFQQIGSFSLQVAHELNPFPSSSQWLVRKKNISSRTNRLLAFDARRAQEEEWPLHVARRVLLLTAGKHQKEIVIETKIRRKKVCDS